MSAKQQLYNLLSTLKEAGKKNHVFVFLTPPPLNALNKLTAEQYLDKIRRLERHVTLLLLFSPANVLPATTQLFPSYIRAQSCPSAPLANADANCAHLTGTAKNALVQLLDRLTPALAPDFTY